uniref:Uncharacterized protein n=1 Tax=Knipowitschia caucasica TaxID=637954 RepID=A0AAV2LV14_KNICA
MNEGRRSLAVRKLRLWSRDITHEKARSRSAGPGRCESAGPGQEQIRGTRPVRISGTRPGADPRDQAGADQRDQAGADQRDQARSRAAGPSRSGAAGPGPERISGTSLQGQETQKRPDKLRRQTKGPDQREAGDTLAVFQRQTVVHCFSSRL